MPAVPSKTPMKTTRTFNGYWFCFALVAAVAIGELLAWKLTELYGLKLSGIGTGALCVGIVLAATSVLYDGADLG